MFINISNHPTAKWGKEQLEAARTLGGGEIVDIPFAQVPPSATTAEVVKLACEVVSEVDRLVPARSGVVVHVMGEMTLTHALVSILRTTRRMTCTVVASTTERVAVERADGTKESVFRFVQFREYPGGLE